MPAALTPERYVDALHRDGELLLTSADGMLDAQVPQCAGWSVRDVVGHVGAVYGHKIAALRLGRQPREGEWTLWPNSDVPADDVVDWCHGLLHDLAAELCHGVSTDPAWTWWPPDQTRGFWQRRMALETAVHRTDVESAVGDLSPIAADLAADGVDEVLSVMLVDSGFDRPTSTGVDGARATATIGTVSISGDPSDVLLWLWGRAGDSAVDLVGTDTDRATVRAALYLATQ